VLGELLRWVQVLRSDYMRHFPGPFMIVSLCFVGDFCFVSVPEKRNNRV
jgi:hypothetical protein